jgi:signal transduction histidine kinase
MAVEESEPGSELSEQLTAILDCAKQAATIVNGVLSIARKQRPAPEPLVLAQSLRKAVNFLSAILPRETRLELAVSCGEEAALYEEGELSQVLLNLVRNASAAMQGVGLVRISLEHCGRERADESTGRVLTVRCLKLCVADSGSGMSADVAARAFQPFFTTKAPRDGTGLGLSIVMAIVYSWNGEIEIETAPGAGTRISVVLPI